MIHLLKFKEIFQQYKTMPDKANIDFYLYHLNNTFRRTRFKMKWLMVCSTSSVFKYNEKLGYLQHILDKRTNP